MVRKNQQYGTIKKVEGRSYHARKRMRYDRWNYATPWWYFVTICVHNHLQIFGKIPYPVGATRASPTNIENKPGGARPAPTLGNIIGSFKSECTKRIRTQNNNPTLILWQRGYYDRIIRNDSELERIKTYILDNPKNWTDDEYFM